MRFYYTTSEGEGFEQKKNILSIGGYKSSTLVPNNYFNNLFGDITPYTIDKDQEEYIAMMLVNETGANKTNLQLHFEFPEDSYSKYEVGAVVPSKDSEGTDVVERVNNIYSQPFDPTFVEADGIANQVGLGDLAEGAKLGICIRRTILKDAIDADYEGRLEKQGDIYIENELNKKDQINVVLNWD